MLNFENLRVYNAALEYVDFVFKQIEKWPNSLRFSLTDQLVRASLSVTLNIAEGSARTKKDFRHFLDLSRGSCYESITCWEIAYRNGLIDLETRDKFRNKLIEITKMLSGLKKSQV